MSARVEAVSLASALLVLTFTSCTSESPRAATKLNRQASLAGPLHSTPLQGFIITSWVDEPKATMSTLYGNDVAVRYARANPQHDYPAGSVLSLVAWNQQEDERWFGAKIPAAPQSIEVVSVTTGADRQPMFLYERFEGEPLKAISTQQGAAPNDRAAYLLSQRAAVMP